MLAARIPRARVAVARGEGHFLLLDEPSPALAPIRSFLSAASLPESPVWRTAVRPDRPALAAQLRADGLGAPPWGPVSAVVRRLVPG